MTDQTELEQKPWFKNPMVWLVIFFPSLAVVAGTITIIIALNTEDGLVVDEYYKQGLAINEVIKYDQQAKQMGLSAFVDANSQTGEILLSLSAETRIQFPAEITFKLIHRTRSGLDQTTVLQRKDDSADYRGYLRPPIIEGRWTVQVIAEEQWRLKQNFTTKSAEHILMNITS
ncbi:MAG: FixH family protein [Gammaproteobacteria bacterium]|nr:FixH family protein [Gammaproteobacteria bacterium]